MVCWMVFIRNKSKLDRREKVFIEEINRLNDIIKSLKVKLKETTDLVKLYDNQIDDMQ